MIKLQYSIIEDASVDHTTFVTITQTADIFVDSLVEYLLKLRKHDFIAKEQAAFLVEKSSLQEGEIVVLGDFAENYSFVIQDAVQGFHWNNTQATIHPFVAYYYDAVRGEVCFLNFVIISDSLTHDSVAVHCFVKKLLTFLVTKLTVKKVYYFSDGAASQYKNKKNFVNLAFHNRDFKNIEAEWHFFATAHGKGPCDGLGGTVKREAVSTSLKRPLEGQIQTPQELSEWAKDAIPSVTFEFVDKKETPVTRVSSEDMEMETSQTLAQISATAGVEAAELSNEAKDKVLQRSVALPQARSLLVWGLLESTRRDNNLNHFHLTL
ncbi:hypothetical protein EMCRGX_G016833 [Ephydatia muelleri]